MFIPPLVRIDYIWHSAGLRALQAWQGPAIGSDHLPLQAILEFVPLRQPS
jgi:endonuclease/exonuclease/phosphatase (EEP) superfamily protein YafD